MNVMDNLLLYTQMQMGLPQQNTQPKADTGSSFRDQLAQSREDGAQKQPTDKDSASVAGKPSQEESSVAGQGKPTQEESALDPYRQQMLAAAAMSPVMMQIVEQPVTPEVVAQPVEAVEIPVEQPLVQQAEVPVQAAEAEQPVQQQQVDGFTQVLEETQQPDTVTPQQIVPKQVQQVVQPQQTDVQQAKSTTPAESVEVQDAAVAIEDAPEADADTQLGQSAKRGQDEPEVMAASVQTERPVFEKVESAPIKVADAPELDTEAPDMDAQLAAKVDKAFQKGESSIVLRLNPQNLGSVTVQLTRAQDGTLQVTLSASNERAANLLEKHASRLEGLLMSSNHTTAQVDVQRQGENQQPHNEQPFDREGQGRQGQQQSRQNRQGSDAQDFLQQLRLGLVPSEAEIV